MTALKEKLLSLIRAQGPITVAHYMQSALADPLHGYYMRADPLGRDFITAPEVSQIFGEMIGLFLVQAWEDRGRPESFHLVELGPGRGTLMADMMRAAAKVRPDFAAAAQIILVETSPALRAIQARTLSHCSVRWTKALEEIGAGPIFLVANEFFDALPIRQFVKSPRGWHERMVAGEAELAFVATPETVPAAIIPGPLRDAKPGSVYELGPSARIIIQQIAAKIRKDGGLALAIDYGRAESAAGDTLQAVRAHRSADVLGDPGAADLTAHVDFAALKEAALHEGAKVYGPLPQGEFLEALGIMFRAERLKQAAPERAGEIDAALTRLIAPEQMGTLFKAMAVTAEGSPAPPGFP